MDLLILLLLPCFGLCFQLDLEVLHIYNVSGDNSQMFGYSLAFLNGTLLVGAPKLNTSQLSQYNIVEAGGVYSCKLHGGMECSVLEIDRAGNNIATAQYNYASIEDKNHQWLGATIDADAYSGLFTACAPFYVYKSPQADKREPVGQCYRSYYSETGSASYYSYSPCKDDFKDFLDRFGERVRDSEFVDAYCYSRKPTDVDTVQTFRGDQEDSYFGYSVSLLLSSNGNQVLIGAPKANRSQLLLNGITNSGALYKCFIGSGTCSSMEVDDRPNLFAEGMEPASRGLIGESRSDQWLGASLATTSSGTVAVCAPRYVNFSPRATKREPTGDCFVSKDSGLKFQRISPCNDDFTTFYKRTYVFPNSDKGFPNYHMTGHGMCGFSVTLDPNGELGVGSVGSYYWQGKLYSVSASSRYTSYASTDMSANKLDDDSYMTWDLKPGEFDNDNATQDYAASAPRARMLKGLVSIYSKISNDKVISIVNITGEQAGSYFGYALAVGDFNGDDKDDVAVGAPFYAEYQTESIEVGRVVVFYQQIRGGRIEMKNETQLRATQAKGRFGQSMANVGDLNLDGCEELVVGAPYGGPNGKGVIFLYHGSPTGLLEKPTQVIHSEDLPNQLQTFGWSIAGKMDVDDNRYYDIAVGAYKSNAAVLLKTRPLVRLEGVIQGSETELQLPVPCSKGYELFSTQNPKKFRIEYCILYRALKEPEEIYLKTILHLDAKNNQTKRAYELLTGESSVERFLTLKKRPGSAICTNVDGYINPNIRDKTSPIVVSLDFELKGSSTDGQNTPRPILDQLSTKIQPFIIKLLKSCERCNPDLKISVFTPTQFYTLGSDDKIDLQVTLTNTGEDSYLTSLNMTLPEDVSYVNVVEVDSCIPIACQQVIVNGTEPDYVNCDVGNPFPHRQTAKFTIKMRVDDLHKIDVTQLNFDFTVKSSYAEDVNPNDNKFEVTIPMKVETSIFVTGTAYPSDAVIYNDTHISTHRGPYVEHKYEIYTTGPSAVKSARVHIKWPMFSKDSEGFLMYLYEFPEVLQGNADCVMPVNYINPRNVSLDTSGPTPVYSVTKRYRRSAESDSLVSCNSNKLSCIDIVCNVRDLYRESVIVKIKSFLWIGRAFENITAGYSKATILSSTTTAEVTDVPYTIKPSKYPSSSFTVKSYFEKYRPTQVIKPIEWKWIVIGVSIGLFLLILIIIILWRCGFFKRYRPHAVAKVEKHKDGELHETERLHPGYH